VLDGFGHSGLNLHQYRTEFTATVTQGVPLEQSETK
jgi:hypothetical protein